METTISVPQLEQLLTEMNAEVVENVRGKTKSFVTSFTDISSSDWFYESAIFAEEQGLMSGTGIASFFYR